MSASYYRSTAREIFLFALNSANIDSAFKRHVEYSRGVLRIRDDLFKLDDYSRVVAVSFGKAGHTMAQALREQLGTVVSGIASPPHPPHPSQPPPFPYFPPSNPPP